MVDELNGLAPNTSEDTPVSLIYDVNRVVADLGSYEIQILEYPNQEASISLQTASIDIDSNTFVTDVFDTIEYSTAYTDAANITPYTLPNSVFYMLDYAEQQTTLPWCGAYVTAAILRLKTQNPSITARSIMVDHYEDDDDILKDCSLSISQTIESAQLRGFYNLTWTYSALSSSSAILDLVYNGPFYMYLTRADHAHAIACIGYNDTYSCLYVWNPWYTTHESMDWDTTTYVPINHTSRVYTWAGTIYNWT